MDLEAIEKGALHHFSTMRHPADYGEAGPGPLIRAVDEALKAVTVAGDFRPVLAVAAVVGLGLLATFRFRPALILGLVTLAAVLLSDYSKNWVRRSRPDVPGQKQRADDGSSFPSGHALRTGAVFVTAAWLLARRTSRPWQARSLLGATGLLVFLIGFSRMWLGVHWVSDVLGGWAAGLGLAFLARWADGVGAKCPARPGPALLPPA